MEKKTKIEIEILQKLENKFIKKTEKINRL